MTRKRKFNCHPQRAFELRTRLGFTQQHIADLLGSSSNRISKMENGHLPVPKYLMIIYDLLGRLKKPEEYQAPVGK